MVQALTEDDSIHHYAQRKRALRAQVIGAGVTVMDIALADKIATLQHARITATRVRRRKLAHYDATTRGRRQRRRSAVPAGRGTPRPEHLTLTRRTCGNTPPPAMRPTVHPRATEALRRLRDLAFYMGYRADRREGRVTPGLCVRSGKMGSASTDSPGVLLSSRGGSERVIALRPRDGPLRADGSAVVNSGCTRPDAALPRPTDRRPRRVAPDQPGNGTGVRSPGA
jgi:hypothetical protein